MNLSSSIDISTVMIACAKENWFDKPSAENSKAGPYAKNSRMFNKVTTR